MNNVASARTGNRKRKSQMAARRNISLPPAMDVSADLIIAKLGFSGLSDYVQSCLRKDGEAMLAA